MNDPLSNDIIEDRSVLFYPNPTTGIVKATFIIPEESKVRINIIPVTGGTSDVLSNKMMESGTQELSIDLSNYSGGVYLIQLYVNESLYTTSKVVKF
ncbi:MAG: T9SS type A sorting domain-containing protein [Cytophagales bacterium]|nr:T9SS type A sorting domain-containing protein [Cytophaga sp.]